MSEPAVPVAEAPTTSIPYVPRFSAGWPARAERLVAPALIEVVPRDHQQADSAFRRRRIVSAITLVLGTTLLGISLATPPGSAAFYPLTASVAVVWVIGGFASGPLHLGYIPYRGALRRPIVTPIVLGLVASAVFVVGALIVAQIGPLADIVRHVLEHANKGNFGLILLVTLLNGAAEEIFFRGALFAAVGRRYPIAVSTIVYALATIATGNVVLVFAALIMGVVWGLQRRASGGILASTLTHLTWSIIMLVALPPIFH